MHLPGFGPKRARRLYDELGIDSLEALRAAAEEGKIREPARLRRQGRGEPAADPRRRPRRDAAAAHPAAPRARARPSRSPARSPRFPGADQVEIAGSARRLADSVKDIDLIATAADPGALVSALAELPLIESRPPGRERRPRDARTPA